MQQSETKKPAIGNVHKAQRGEDLQMHAKPAEAEQRTGDDQSQGSGTGELCGIHSAAAEFADQTNRQKQYGGKKRLDDSGNAHE